MYTTCVYCNREFESFRDRSQHESFCVGIGTYDDKADRIREIERNDDLAYEDRRNDERCY